VKLRSWHALRSRGSSPRFLVVIALGLALAAAAASVLGLQRGGAANVVAAALWLLSGALSVRARVLARRRPLGPRQRGTLLERLCQLEPLEVRVSAVNQAAAVRYARDLRNVMHAAAWPASGVYKRAEADAPAGVALAVRNIVAPPGEAVVLLDTLRRLGTPVVWAHKPELSDNRTIEILVGRLG
jgi:hypothetical protein